MERFDDTTGDQDLPAPKKQKKQARTGDVFARKTIHHTNAPKLMTKVYKISRCASSYCRVQYETPAVEYSRHPHYLEYQVFRLPSLRQWCTTLLFLFSPRCEARSGSMISSWPPGSCLPALEEGPQKSPRPPRLPRPPQRQAASGRRSS